MKSNPFSTRYIRPGAIAYLFAPGQSAESLVRTLRENQWQGQIIGPHGSGKSTLLAALVPPLEDAGRNVIRVNLRPAESTPVFSRGDRPAAVALAPSMLRSDTQVVIDGFEQLPWWSRGRIPALCRRHGAGLLITAHQNMGLPTLLQTAPSLELAQQIVASLLPPGERVITPDDVTVAFQASGGDLRETLFALYDTYEQRRCGRGGGGWRNRVTE